MGKEHLPPFSLIYKAELDVGLSGELQAVGQCGSESRLNGSRISDNDPRRICLYYVSSRVG